MKSLIKRYLRKNGRFAGSRRIETNVSEITIGSGKATAIIDEVYRRLKDETRKSFIKRIILMNTDLIGYIIGDYKGEFGTPIETGRAQSSWRISINTPDLSMEPRSTKESPKNYRGKKQSFAAESAKLKNFKKLGDSIYISNSLPYIYKLEYGGHSKQNSYFVAKATKRVIEEYS